MAKYVIENQIAALRKIMSEMPLRETATIKAKKIALEVKRLEHIYIQNFPHSLNTSDCG